MAPSIQAFNCMPPSSPLAPLLAPSPLIPTAHRRTAYAHPPSVPERLGKLGVVNLAIAR